MKLSPSPKSRFSERVYQTAFVWFFALAACSNGSPDLRQNSDAPRLASTGLTITELDTSAVLTGTCDDLGRLDRGFSLKLDGSTWVSQPTLTCVNGAFSHRVAALGTEMGFTPRKREKRFAVVRRSSATGKVTDLPIEVTYLPNVMPGGFAEGGGVLRAPGKYILRGSFSGIQKESATVLRTTPAKFQMILNRDKGDL